jgi:hypothetical protein
MRRRKRKSSAAMQYPMRSKHHLTPKSRGGEKRNPSNIILLRVERHEAMHYLFGNKTLEEIIQLLLRVHRMKGRCTKKLGLCILEEQNGDRRQNSYTN